MFNPNVACPGYYSVVQQLLYQQHYLQLVWNSRMCSTSAFPGTNSQSLTINETPISNPQFRDGLNIKQEEDDHQEQDQLTNKSEEFNEDEDEPRVNGHWTRAEHQMYLKFVASHEDILRSKYDKKSKKIFKLMSQSITTRTATQCRSHHQKFNPLGKGKKKAFKVARNSIK